MIAETVFSEGYSIIYIGEHAMFNTEPGTAGAGTTRPWPADRVERWPIERLIPYANNARLHSAADPERSPLRHGHYSAEAIARRRDLSSRHRRVRGPNPISQPQPDRQTILTSTDTDMATLESDSYRDVTPPLQATELRDARSSGNGGEHHKRKPPKIKVKSTPGKSLKVDMQPIDAVRLLSAFGTVEAGFASLMLSGIINAGCDGGPAHLPGSEDINDALAAVTGIGARDETERMLATQMVATHFAAISALRRRKGSEKVSQQDSNGNVAVKLLRTFTSQMEALQRYRGKGQQKVTVEHVHVNAGSQAIVGVVHSPEVNSAESEQQADAP